MGKRIAIAAIGTHGDIRPFVALGRALTERGHSPVIGAPGDFRSFVEANDVEFFDFGGDMQALLQQKNFDVAMQRHSWAAITSASWDGMKLHLTASRNFLDLARGADAIVYHMNTTHALDVAHKLGIPAFMAVFQPLLPTRTMPYCAMIGPKLPRWLDTLTYAVESVQQTYYDIPRYALRHRLGYFPLFRTGFAKAIGGGYVPTLHAYPEAVVPRPPDWPDNAQMTGHWRLDERPDWELPDDLKAFIEAGDPPIYIGFGSMAFGSARNEEIVREALRLWGGRAVLARGWGGISGAEVPPNAFLLDKAPHDKLFPLMQAVVHHGGAGTTLAGLTASRPGLVIPQFFDQPFWGDRVHDLGCGPKPIWHRHLTGKGLAEGLDALSRNGHFAEAAQRIGAQLVSENGAETAARRIETLMEAS